MPTEWEVPGKVTGALETTEAPFCVVVTLRVVVPAGLESKTVPDIPANEAAKAALIVAGGAATVRLGGAESALNPVAPRETELPAASAVRTASK